jgi:hypothetical protein
MAHSVANRCHTPTEAAWKLRNRLNPQWCPDPRAPGVTQPPFHIPPREWWPRLREDLGTLSYELVGKKTKLLSKDAHRDRLGRSPDSGDALLMTYAFL